MTHKMMNLRPAAPVTCAWRLTGDSRTPLACVWTAVENLNASSINPARIAPPSAETEEGGMRLCA